MACIYTFVAVSTAAASRIKCHFPWGERAHNKVCRYHQKSKGRLGHSSSTATYQRGHTTTDCDCTRQPEHPHRLRRTDIQPACTAPRYYPRDFPGIRPELCNG